MKKKLFACLAALILCVVAVVPAGAAENGFSNQYYRVLDGAALLSEDEEAALMERLDEISERQHFELVVATTKSLYDKTVSDFADDTYDYCDFGYGEDRDGALLLINIEENDWYISSCGRGIEVFTDYGIEYIGSQMKDQLSGGEFAQAFETFASLCDSFITAADKGHPFDVGDNADTLAEVNSSLPVYTIFIALGVGAVVAAVAVGFMVYRLRSVRKKASSDGYVKRGSMKLTGQQDVFLYKDVTRTEKVQENDSAGGSSTHVSPSGTVHGGGGGKF